MQVEQPRRRLCARLWWPTLHKHSKAYCRACDACHRMGKPSQRDEFTLNLEISLQVFEKWAIYFVGLIQPPSVGIMALVWLDDISVVLDGNSLK